jgi:hypothetical protein
MKPRLSHIRELSSIPNLPYSHFHLITLYLRGCVVDSARKLPVGVLRAFLLGEPMVED